MFKLVSTATKLLRMITLSSSKSLQLPHLPEDVNKEIGLPEEKGAYLINVKKENESISAKQKTLIIISVTFEAKVVIENQM